MMVDVLFFRYLNYIYIMYVRNEMGLFEMSKAVKIKLNCSLNNSLLQRLWVGS
jgi:hypothetical protein